MFTREKFDHRPFIVPKRCKMLCLISTAAESNANHATVEQVVVLFDGTSNCITVFHASPTLKAREEMHEV